MTTRIAIYGGTNLREDRQEFVHSLTRVLVRFPDVVLLSGGFKFFKRYPRHVSVDSAVLSEAEKHLDPAEFPKRFETWLPALDRNPVERFEKGTVHRLTGTAQARRFALVNTADALITVAGEGKTRMVLELALALEKPALPLAFTGGDSQRIWKRNREALIAPLRLTPQLAARLESEPASAPERERLAADVARAVHDAAEKRCLVLMPFGPGHDGFYKRVLHRAVLGKGFIPHRIDKDEYAGNIPSLFLSALARARAVVIDVTGANANVMYELGHVHARGISPFLFRRHSPRTARIAVPFYLQHERVVSTPDDEAGHRLIASEVGRYLERLAKNAGEGRRGS